MKFIKESLPISIVGSGSTLNEAKDIGLGRAAELFEVPVPEIMNRATMTGSIEIGRHSGIVTVMFLTPKEYLKKVSLDGIVADHYR